MEPLAFRGPRWLIERFTDGQTKRIRRSVVKAPREEVIEGVCWRFTRNGDFIDIEQVPRA